MIASMDITPEHTARVMDNDLHPDVKAAYAYVDRVSHTADIQAAPGIPAWHGWAIREAFLAGCSHAAAESQPEPDEGRELQWPPSVAVGCHEAAVEAEPGSPLQQLLIAAGDLLESRWCRPTIQPVPVAELPGPEDCDAEGRCWLCGKVEGDWRLLNLTRVPQLKYCFSHWLPHWALPTP
jgi:hypothetical protein